MRLVRRPVIIDVVSVARSSRAVRYALLIVASVLAGCGPSRDTPSPANEALESGEPLSSRAALSARLAEGQRRLPYSEAWTVLADGASVGPERLRLFYSRRVIPASHRARGDDQSERDYWNREHVWPRSAGIDDTPADVDLHNLVPTDQTVNSSRGNKFFDSAETPHHECTGCRVSGEAWTPAVETRGDVARILFYMDVRYEGAIADGVPDLVLSETVSLSDARFARLSTLLAWHCADPVSDEERQRHEAVVAAQGNRNAFIDDPDWVARLYGMVC